MWKWRRKWYPTPECLPRESCGERSQVGCCLWRRTESNTTDAEAETPILWPFDTKNQLNGKDTDAGND